MRKKTSLLKSLFIDALNHNKKSQKEVQREVSKNQFPNICNVEESSFGVRCP